jgi:hypothetical protein
MVYPCACGSFCNRIDYTTSGIPWVQLLEWASTLVSSDYTKESQQEFLRPLPGTLKPGSDLRNANIYLVAPDDPTLMTKASVQFKIALTICIGHPKGFGQSIYQHPVIRWYLERHLCNRTLITQRAYKHQKVSEDKFFSTR